MIGKYILLSGFGWSGSGAIYDFLSDFNCIKTFQQEFRLFKDIDGLINLRDQFKENSYFLNTSIAIERFRKFCTILARDNHGIKFGLNYSEIYNSSFLSEIDQFIDNLKIGVYQSDAFIFQYDKSNLKQSIWKLGVILNARNYSKYIMPVNLTCFDTCAKQLISNIFYKDIMNKKLILLDQAINPWSISEVDPFIENYKAIIVGRDPRDTYLDIKKTGIFKWDVEVFVNNYRSLYDKTKDNITNNTLFIQYEDFVLNNEIVSLKILDHIGLRSTDRVRNNYKYQDSKKNIGRYKIIENNAEIQYIKDELNDYCFEF